MSSEIDTIKAAEARLLQAVKANDANSIVALLHNELRFVLPTGQIITKTMEHAAYTQRLMSVETLQAAEPEVVLHADTAIVTVNVKLVGRYQEQPIDGTFLYLRIWKRNGAEWQVIAGSCTPLPG